jgi:hypothetical protein
MPKTYYPAGDEVADRVATLITNFRHEHAIDLHLGWMRRDARR